MLKYHHRKRLIFSTIFILIFSLSGYSVCAETGSGVKNIILVIGDGMGFPAVGLLRNYARYAPHSIYKSQSGKTNLEQAMERGTLGLMFTEPFDAPVVDSAASASQIATGEASPLQAVGSDRFGNPAETVLQKAKQMGKATGLISDTRITHATPASFASHVPQRGRESEIAVQLINKHGPDVMLGGGIRYFVPSSANNFNSETSRKLATRYSIPFPFRSRRKDGRNLLRDAEENLKYQLAFSKEAMQAATGPKLLGLFSYSGMQDGITETWDRHDPNRSWPTLSEMTQKALEILDQDPDGFFLMIEAGQIDWAEHNQDAGQLLHETLKLDRTIETVLNWVGNRQDTVVIITADHDTGGFSMTYTAYNLPNTPQDLPGSLFEKTQYQPTNNFGSFDVFDTLYNQKQSFQTLLSTFNRLDKNQQTHQKLIAMVEAGTGVTITLDDAMALMKERKNPYRVPSHTHLKSEYVPDAGIRQAYFTNLSNMLGGILASRIGIAQNISWATGTHSATPVPVIMIAPENCTIELPNVMHTTDLGRIMKTLVEKK